MVHHNTHPFRKRDFSKVSAERSHCGSMMCAFGTFHLLEDMRNNDVSEVPANIRNQFVYISKPINHTIPANQPTSQPAMRIPRKNTSETAKNISILTFDLKITINNTWKCIQIAGQLCQYHVKMHTSCFPAIGIPRKNAYKLLPSYADTM